MRGPSVEDRPRTQPLIPSGTVGFWQVFVSVTRASAWWEHKVPTFLAVAYLTACAEGIPFERLWPQLVVLIVAVAAAASYASILNDITDAGDDARAGKPNRMTGRTTRFKAASLAACLVVGMLCAWLFRASALTVVLYAATWLAFTLYSAPPFRLKSRGIFGVLCDASGGQVLPSLWGSTYVMATTARGVDPSLLLPLGVWSAALGVRGILSHQLLDFSNDKASNVPTLAVRLGRERTARWMTFAVFPLEILGLIGLFMRVGAPLTWPLLAVHLFFVWQMARWLEIKPVVVPRAASFRFLLFKYYVTFFPLTFIIALAQSSWAALGLLLFHAVAFPDTWRRFPRHARDVLRHRRAERTAARDARTAPLHEAVQRGLHFLSTAQYPDGEFQTLLDTEESLENGLPDSSPFTTALVCYSLESCLPDSKPLIDRAVAFLKEHMEEGGAWRYYTAKAFKHDRIPPDLDDTACVSYVLKSHLGRAPSNRWIFLNSRNPEGLFCTWLLPQDSTNHEFRRYMQKLEKSAAARTPPMPAKFQGSARFYHAKDPVVAGEVDSVVNANVVFYLGEAPDTRPAIIYLINLIQKNLEQGSSCYYNDVFALYYMLARAASKSAPTLRAIAAPVARRIEERLQNRREDLPPLLLALGACALLTFRARSPILPKVIDLLFQAQRGDGSWPRCTFYRGPQEFWGSDELTTGFCLEALARYAAVCR